MNITVITHHAADVLFDVGAAEQQLAQRSPLRLLIGDANAGQLHGRAVSMVN